MNQTGIFRPFWKNGKKLEFSETPEHVVLWSRDWGNAKKRIWIWYTFFFTLPLFLLQKYKAQSFQLGLNQKLYKYIRVLHRKSDGLAS